MTEQPIFSIIIPTLNSPQLSGTLHAIENQTALDKIKEIIIVGQQKILESPHLPNLIYLYVSTMPSPANNRNLGAKQASGEWLLFTDSDCLPKPDWVEKLITSITPEDMVIAGAVDVPTHMSYWGRCDHYFGFEKTAYGITNPTFISYAATLNFAIKQSLFIELGGFNVSFIKAGGEDRELCWRINKSGVSIRFIPDAIVIHDHMRASFKSAYRHIFYYGEVTGQFRIIHNNNVSSIMRLAMHVVKLPIVGEIGGLLRVFLRTLVRLVNKKYFRIMVFLPGIMILDLAHTFGMIKALRSYD